MGKNSRTSLGFGILFMLGIAGAYFLIKSKGTFHKREPAALSRPRKAKDEADNLPIPDLQKLNLRLVPRSGIEPIFYNEKRTLYKYTMDPTSGLLPRWVRQPFERIFLMSGAPVSTYFSEAEPLEQIFVNFRCLFTKGGWESNKNNILESAAQAYCHRLFREPWSTNDDLLGPWVQGTRVVWGAHHVNLGGLEHLALVQMTQNQTGFNLKGQLTRGPRPYEKTGFVEYRIDGQPVDMENLTQNMIDGFTMNFITLGLLPLANNFNKIPPPLAQDLGPIIWPINGYRTWNSALKSPKGQGSLGAWQQVSLGVRDPRGFIWKNHLYIFYYENSFQNDSLRAPSQTGIYVARSSLKMGLRPGTFFCGKNFSESCLPKDFSEDTPEEFAKSLSLRGPQVNPIISGDECINFSVTAVEGHQLFLGLLGHYNSGKKRGGISLYSSTDLLTWKWVQEIEIFSYNSEYGKGPLQGPLFVSHKGGNDKINADDFYIIGTNNKDCPAWPCNLQRVKFRLEGLH